MGVNFSTRDSQCHAEERMQNRVRDRCMDITNLHCVLIDCRDLETESWELAECVIDFKELTGALHAKNLGASLMTCIKIAGLVENVGTRFTSVL